MPSSCSAPAVISDADAVYWLTSTLTGIVTEASPSASIVVACRRALRRSSSALLAMNRELMSSAEST